MARTDSGESRQSRPARLRSAPLRPFPPDFLFGVATADHQSEAYEAGRDDVWDDWERQRGLTQRGQATDFWHRFQEDIDLARGLGCRAFRFSIAWARVEPSPGIYDDAAFEHYRTVVAAIRAAGMEPIVTLLHFTWPRHVQARGGLVAQDFPATFERYAREVGRRVGDGVRYWISFNEPTQLVFGYVKLPWMAEYPLPPGLPAGATFEDQAAAAGQLMRNLFVAHTAARAAIRQERPDALVGANPLLLGLPDWLQRVVDWNATRQRDFAAMKRHSRRIAGHIGVLGARKPVPAGRSAGGPLAPVWQTVTVLSTIFSSNWWHLGMAGKLAPFLCPPTCHGQQDFVGLDYYWGIRSLALVRLRRLLSAAFGQYDEAPVWPRALYDALKWHARQFPGRPILIIENGSVNLTDGVERAVYVQRHIREAQRAMSQGVPVVAYVCWSITSNREWGLPFGHGSDFGLYHVDLDHDPTLRRTPTPAADVYCQIIAAHGVPQPAGR